MLIILSTELEHELTHIGQYGKHFASDGLMLKSCNLKCPTSPRNLQPDVVLGRHFVYISVADMGRKSI